MRPLDRDSWDELRWLWVAGVWLASAALFVWLRTPYDDEWFSIKLALRSDAAPFWRTLQRDLHPPWLACLDRALGSVWHARYLLHGVRLLAAAVALGLTAPWLAARARVPREVIWLAAFHPIVFMYSGAARWYSFLLLAHALRARALWGDDKPRQRQLGFIAGSAIGAVASYVDAWFLVHDSVWWLFRARADALGRRRAWATLAASVACVVGLRWLSPLGFLHRLHWQAEGLSAQSWLTWAGLGCIGEAGPPWPWLLISVVVPIAFGRAVWVGLRDPASRTWCVYLLSCLVAWSLATAYRVWHPRYSLWIWFALSGWTFVLFRRTWVERMVLVLTLCWWITTLGFMGSGRGFYKSDLNELTDTDCASLRRHEGADLIVIPYRRLAELTEKRCALVPPTLRLPAIIEVHDEAEQVRPLRAALRARPRVVWLLHLTATPSVTLAEERARAVLSARCRHVADHEVGETAHREIKSLFTTVSRSRLTQEVWSCQ